MNSQKNTRTQKSQPKKNQGTQNNNGQKKGKSRNRQDSRVTQVPVSFGNTTTNKRPRMNTTKGTDIIVEHREFVATVPRSTSAFQVVVNSNGLDINPSNSALFPWLSALAGRYESYVFESLKIEFKTESSSSTSGFILFAVEYNADDGPPVSKQQALQYQSVLSGPYWQNMEVNLRKEDLHKRKSYLCNNSLVSTNIEKNLYNTGKIFVCVGGSGDANAAGDLYVSYKVRFMTPELNALPGQALLTSTSQNDATSHPFTTVAVEDTLNIGRPLINEFAQDGTRFTAQKTLRMLFDADFGGTGMTAPNVLGSMFHTGTGSEVPVVQNIANLGIGQQAFASTIGEMVKGNYFDVSEIVLPGGWDTLTNAAIRLTPWSSLLG